MVTLDALELCVKGQKDVSFAKRTHQVYTCPVRKRPHQMAKYVGRAAPGLGFYHLETSDMRQSSIGSMRNCGVVYVETRMVNKEELA